MRIGESAGLEWLIYRLGHKPFEVADGGQLRRFARETLVERAGVVEHLGLADACEELGQFRRFKPVSDPPIDNRQRPRDS